MTEQACGEVRRVRLRCWGDFALEDVATGADIRPRGRKARALLAYLALHPGRAVSRERLTALLWSDRADVQARASLRQSIHELRFLAGGDGPLRIGREHLVVDPEYLTTDLESLRQAAARGDRSAVLAALPDPDERLLANLDSLSEGFDDWLRVERSRRDGIVAELEAAARDTRTSANFRTVEIGRSAPTPALPDEPGRRPSPAKVGLVVAAALAGSAALYVGPGSGNAPQTLAVLPFDGPAGIRQSAFADGLSEEVLAQLARRSGLRVTGRTSSWQFKDRHADLAEIGRKLRVRYLLEGSVRTAGDRVRVIVALARASDGTQLWSGTFDGAVTETFAIQERIGAQVAEELGHVLAPGASRQTRPVNGLAYSGYLAARGRIRERSPSGMALAEAQLRRAVAIAPDFAPAWASLAQVRRWYGNDPGEAGRGARADALAYARRAVALAPDLAEAHGVLGMVIGFEDAAGRRHIRTAAALDPGNSELQFWLGNAFGAEGRFDLQQVAYRRAFDLDPLWGRAQQAAAETAWRMGDVRAARAVAWRVEREGSRFDARMLRGMVAMIAGDLSGAIAQFGAAEAASSDAGRRSMASLYQASALFQLGLVDRAVAEWAHCRSLWQGRQGGALMMPTRHAAHWQLKRGRLPTARQLAEADAADDPAGRALASAMARSLTRAGRSDLVVRQYDTPKGLLGFASRRRLPTELSANIRDAPVIAVALRTRGRDVEADRMLRNASAVIARAYRLSGGRVPTHVAAEAAQVWALSGERERALRSIERARRHGWVNADFVAGDLSDDIGREPAFAGLLGDARFEALRRDMAGALARERREALAVLAGGNRRRAASSPTI